MKNIRRVIAVLLCIAMVLSMVGTSGVTAYAEGQEGENINTASTTDAGSEDTSGETEYVEVDEAALDDMTGDSGAEAEGYMLEPKKMYLSAPSNESEFYDISSYLNSHVIMIDDVEYDHVSQLSPQKSFELHLDFSLDRLDLKNNGLLYKYDLPDHITIGDVGAEDDQRNLYNSRGQTIGTYFIADDVIYITFPGYYDNVTAYFNLKANWSDVDNLVSVNIAWPDGNELILFDLSAINISKNLTAFAEQDDGSSIAEFSVTVSPSKENTPINELTFNDKYSSASIKLSAGKYDDAGTKKDVKVTTYSHDGSKIGEKFYTYSEVGATDLSKYTCNMTLPDTFDIPANGKIEVNYFVEVSKKTALAVDATGSSAAYSNIANGSYPIKDNDGNVISTASSEIEKTGRFDPRAEWIYKTQADAFEKDDKSAILIPYTIGINRDRKYSLGGSIVQDNITEYNDSQVQYDMTQKPYVTLDDHTETDFELDWVVVDDALFTKMQTYLYHSSSDTAMDNLLTGTSTEIQEIRSALCTTLGVSSLTNDLVSRKIFTSAKANDFLWIVPLDTQPTFYLLHYYTTASYNDMGSNNSAKMWYTEIEGYPRYPGGGWTNPYKKVMEVDKENYGVYEDGDGNFFVDWQISVTVPKGSHFDHIMLSDDLQYKSLNAASTSLKDRVSNSNYTGYYADWFPAAQDISFKTIKESGSVKDTAEYEWAISDQIFDISITSPDATVQNDAELQTVRDNLKGVFADTLDVGDSRRYAVTKANANKEDVNSDWETSYFSHNSNYEGKTFVPYPNFLAGSYFEFLYSTSQFARGQYLGDSDFRGWSYTYYGNQYTWSPGSVRYYIKELPRKDADYTIHIKYTTQINPELIKALPDYCEQDGQEFLVNTNYVRAYQGVYDDTKGGFLYDKNKEIAKAESSYYISKKDVKANILKKVVNYDKNTKTVSYVLEINPNNSLKADKVNYELQDIISYSGVKFNTDSIVLMDDSGSEPGVDGNVIWKYANDNATDHVTAIITNKDSGSSSFSMTLDNSAETFGTEGSQFKHMYLVYTVDGTNWKEEENLNNAVYLYKEDTVPNSTTSYDTFLGTDTCDFVGTDALSKEMTVEGDADNNYTPTFEVILDTQSAEAGDLIGIQPGEKFTIHDEMSDNLTLEQTSVKLEKFNTTNSSWEEMANTEYLAGYDSTQNILDVEVTVPNDASKYKLTYQAIIKPDKYMQVINNKVSVLNHNVAEVEFSKKVYTKTNNAGADADAYKIKLSKYDANDISIPLQASFELYYYDSTTSEWKLRTNGTSADGYFTTNASTGYIEMSNALCGSDPIPIIANKTWYKLVEVKAPTGYQLLKDPIYYYVTDDGSEPSASTKPSEAKSYTPLMVGGGTAVPLNVSNTKLGFDIKKTDSSSTDVLLSGAEFALYSDSACANKVADASEYKAGIYRFKDIDVGSGDVTFYLKETKAPDNYQQDSRVYEVQVVGNVLQSISTDNGQTVLSFDDTDKAYIFGNESNDGSLVIKKTITGYSSSDVQDHKDDEFMFSVNILDSNGKVYTDGQNNEIGFPVVYSRSDGNKINTTYYSGDIIYLKHNESYSITGIPDGANYKVTENKDVQYKTSCKVTDSVSTDTTGDRSGYVATGTIETSASDTIQYTNALLSKITVIKEMKLANDSTAVLDIPDGLTLKVTSNDYNDSNRVTYAVAKWDATNKKFVATTLLDGATFTDNGDGSFSVENVPSGYYRVYEENANIDKLECTASSITDVLSNDGTFFQSRYPVRSGDDRASRITNTYSPAADADVSIGKRVSGRTLMPGDYSFKLYNTNGTADTADDTVVQTVSNAQYGVVKFDTLKFTAVGTYDYYIKEEVPAGATQNNDGTYTLKGITYDNSQIDVSVEVIQDPVSFELTTSVKYYKNGTELTDPDDRVLTNKYAASGSFTLDGNKTLVGRTFAANEFTFLMDSKVKENGVETDLATGVQVGTVNAGTTADPQIGGAYTGSITFDSFDFDQDDIGKTFEYKIYEDDSSALQGITYGTEAYTVTVDVADNGDGTLSLTKTIKDSAGKDVTSLDFTNLFAASGSLTLKATKKLTGKTLTADQFSFQVMEGTTEVATGKCDANGDITFSPISFSLTGSANGVTSNLGTHTYTVKEVIPATVPAGYTYDSTTYTVSVTAAANSQGGIDFTVNGATAEAGSVNTYVVDRASTKAANFVNTYKSSGGFNMSGHKTLNGRSIKDREFFIYGQLYNEQNQMVAEGPLGMAYENGDIKYYNIPVTQENDGVTYTLRIYEYYAGQTMQGVTFDSNYYVLTYKGIDKGDGTMAVEKTLTDSNNNTVAFGADEDTVTGIDFINEYDAKGSVTFSATKLLKGRDIADSTTQTFYFDIYEGNNVVASGSSNDKGEITFDPIEFYIDGSQTGVTSYIGKHEYTIKERIPSPVPDGYTYDNTTYDVTVTATDHGDGTLDIDVQGASLDTAGLTYTVDLPTGTTNTFTNSYKADGSLTFDGTKLLEGRTLNDKEFEFKAVETKYDAVTGDYAETGRVFNGTNDAAGVITFDTVDYTRDENADDVGMYKYLISEVNDGLGGVTYDDTEYSIDVVVADPGDGKLIVDKAISAPVLEFKNKYEATAEEELSVEKRLRHSEASIDKTTLKDGMFEFTLYEYDDGVAGFAAVSTAKNNADGSVKFEKIEYSLKDVGQHIYKIVEKKDNQLANVLYNAEDVYVVVNLSDNGDGTMTKTVAYTSESDVSKLKSGNFEAVTDPLMKNDMTSITVSKVDENGKPLAGAKLVILDDKLANVASFTSTEADEVLYGLKRNVTYTLREAEAPTGYDIASDIQFKLDNDGKLIIVSGTTETKAEKLVMTDKQTAKKTESKPDQPTQPDKPDKSGRPSTGDQIALWAIVMVMTISVLGIVAIIYRKRREEQDDK